MITRGQGDLSVIKLTEIKNRLIQLGLFCELEPLFDNVDDLHLASQSASSSSSSTSGSSSSTGSSTSISTTPAYTTNFNKNYKNNILKSLKNNIEDLLNETEDQIRNHL